MATKHNNLCLNHVRDDEPIFVLRAQDNLASDVVRLWASKAEIAGTPEEKVTEALQCASMMDKWAEVYGSKVPD